MNIERFNEMSLDDRHRWWHEELHQNGGRLSAKHRALITAAAGTRHEGAVSGARHGHVPAALQAFMDLTPEARVDAMYAATGSEIAKLRVQATVALPPDPDPDFEDRISRPRVDGPPVSGIRTRAADPAVWRQRFEIAINDALRVADARVMAEARAAANRAAADYTAAYHARKHA